MPDNQDPNQDNLDPQDWKSSLPDELKSHPAAEKFKTAGDVFKSYVELEKFKGNSITLPGEKATPEELNGFYNKLGRPEKPEGYQFKMPEGLNEKIQLKPEFDGSFRAMMHKHGLSSKQAAGIYNDYLTSLSEMVTQEQKSAETALNNAKAELQKEWGDQYDVNIQAATNLVERVAGKEAVDKLGDLGANPTAIKLLHTLSKAISEDSINTIIGKNDKGVQSSDAAEKIKAIQADKSHPYWNASDPKHADAVQEVRKLYEEAYPKESA